MRATDGGMSGNLAIVFLIKSRLKVNLCGKRMKGCLITTQGGQTVQQTGKVLSF